MVAICAFLIILVILFGVEAVRSFVFGTFGVIAWVVIGIFGLAGLIYAGEWLDKIFKERKQAKLEGKKPPHGDILVYLVMFTILAIATIIILNVFPAHN